MTGRAGGQGQAGGPEQAEGPGQERPDVRLLERVEDGVAWPVLVWDPGPGRRMIASGIAGGGIGLRDWWLNAGVPRDYTRTDPQVHVGEIAARLRLAGDGVGLLTAADVRRYTCAQDGGVQVVATVGLGVPVPAAAPPGRIADEAVPLVGTINLLAVLPVPLTDAALVNAVITLTEAKTQALVEHGVPGTGTSSDAVCIACPDPERSQLGAEPFAGPRSVWGARLARAVHAAVGAGTADWLYRHRAGHVGPAA
jgi:adenosylcobinamide hydrolase